MVYRKPAEVEREPPIFVRYGLFPLPWGGIATTLGLLAIGLLVLAAGMRRDQIRCERERGAAGQCRVDSDLFFTQWNRFSVPLDRFSDVRWVSYEGNRGADRGRTELIDEIGRSITIADGSRSDAHRIYREIRAFYDDREQLTLDVAEPRAWLAISFGVAFIGAFIWGIVWLLQRTTSLRLMIDRERRTLSARRNHFGVPGRTTIIDLDEVTAVEVEEGTVDLWYQRQHTEGRPAGRIVLVTGDRIRRPITDGLLLGKAVHECAASRLREVLLISEPEQAEVRVEGSVSRGPRKARTAPKWQLPFKKRYLLLVIALTFVPGIVVHFQRTLEGPRGTVELRCIHRCKMGGLECLPGGMWQDSFKVGSYSVDVWNPNVAGSWERVDFEVRADEHLVVECRPAKR